jgi:Arc/MetJ family transcription regulator
MRAKLETAHMTIIRAETLPETSLSSLSDFVNQHPRTLTGIQLSLEFLEASSERRVSCGKLRVQLLLFRF